MPLLVPTTDLKAGMKLYAPITANGRVMLQAGKALSAGDIEVLHRRYPTLSVRVEDPVLDHKVEFQDDSKERAVAAEIQKKVNHSMSEVKSRFAERTMLKETDFRVLETTVNDLMDFLKGNPTSAALVMECLDGHGHFGTHVGNVFYLSMLLGSSALDYVSAERKRQTRVSGLKEQHAIDLVPLGLAALVMDLSLLQLEHIHKPDRSLSEEDNNAIREHPTASMAMLPESFSSVARTVVRTHHENYAGEGYPNKLPRDKLHVFARILRIADAYCSATSDKVYCNARSPARALWEMTVGPYRRFFDPALMKSFVRLIQPFPIGAKLRLRDNRYAAVVKYNRGNPFRPIVVIAFDEQDRPIPPEKLDKPINLAESNDVRIASFRGEDLSFLYSALSEEVPMRDRFRQPLDAFYP